MIDELRRTYIMLLIPAIVGFIFLFVAKTYHLINFGPFKFKEFLGPALFIASVIFSDSLTYSFPHPFLHTKCGTKKDVSETDLLKFERTFLYVALLTPYMTLIAYFFVASSLLFVQERF